jgi:hypothetical protein
MVQILSRRERLIDSSKGAGSSESTGFGDYRETVKGSSAKGSQNKSGQQFLCKKQSFGVKGIPNSKGRVSA